MSIRETSTPIPVAERDTATRASFIVKTYLHLLVAVAAFVLIEFLLFSTGLAEPIAREMLRVNWLLILGAFVLASWGGSHLAHRAVGVRTQYAGLGVLVVAEAFIFVPLLWIAETYAPGAIRSAAVVTAIGFGSLTFIAFRTRRDFSFLRSLLMWGFVIAMILIVAAVLWGLQLGTWFAVAMIAFAGGAILYDTSNVLHHYPEDRYVAAALQLFSAVALMFWYVLSIFSSD